MWPMGEIVGVKNLKMKNPLQTQQNEFAPPLVSIL